MTAAQCRMARAALGLTLRELSAVAGVSPNTLSRIESSDNVTSRAIVKVQQALMQRGSVFEANGAVGIRSS
jgi:transcriptional regulator with XRE-family HTH domain